ncbi:MAG TPA: FlgD immunoglobulin-like domain containing protein [Gemmatimonadales bacterium]
MPQQVAAQTFSQVLQLGNQVGARLTRTVTFDGLNSSLFAVMHDQISWIDATGSSPLVYSFAADPVWPKVVFSRKDSWIRGFNDWSASDPLIGPRALDVSGSRKVFITDPPTGRVVVVTLNTSQKKLTRVGSLSATLTFPVGVAWDGGTTPLSSEAVYVLDAVGPVVSYWTKNGSAWTRSWSFGTQGSGPGQFSGPSGICVGHTAASANGNSLFTTNFYVADAGNQRIVWLERRTNGQPPLWRGTRSLPEGWNPADCTVDHFGNVYVADRQNSQIIKYTKDLIELDRYGTYGTGATNYNTFAHPHSVHVPFGKKLVGGNTRWYGEGRLLTAEDWGAGSGGLEHFLGVAIPWATAGGAFGHYADFFLTEHSLLTVQVFNKVDQLQQTIYAGTLFSPYVHSAYWTGLNSSGNPAPDGLYRFKITARSPYCSGPTYCVAVRYTNFFQHTECVDPESIPCNPPDPMERNVALVAVEGLTIAHLPSSYRLGQAITAYEGPLFRLEGLGAASAAAPLSGVDAVASVRAHGIRALTVAVPARAARTPVQIRIYDLSGRLVRVLVDETVEPGRYLVGWDGADASGRAVRPGVYVAMMSAGSFRGVQRLILK